MIELKGLLTKDKLILFWENIQNNISKIYLKKKDIDNFLSFESTNPVSNAALTFMFNKKSDVDEPVFTGSISLGREDESNVGENSFAAGTNVVASGDSSHAQGFHTIANAYQCSIGHYNDETLSTDSVAEGSGTGTSFVIGNGTSESRSNSIRITDNGQIYSKSSSITTGADYAEYFEWEDSNDDSEDRRGYFVTLHGNKIKIATSGDYILGVVSGFPSIIGNGDECWKGRYILDEFDTPIIEEFEYVHGNETKTGVRWKENKNYDASKKYIQRAERPEWDAVGMLGVLSVRDDGSCEVNGFCGVTESGIATKSENGYRVIERVNENIIKIVFK